MDYPAFQRDLYKFGLFFDKNNKILFNNFATPNQSHETLVFYVFSQIYYLLNNMNFRVNISNRRTHLNQSLGQLVGVRESSGATLTSARKSPLLLRRN